MEINAEIPFFIFGQGNRRKYLYQAGKLVDLTSGHTLLNVDIAHQNIVGHEYCVELHSKSGGKVTITEDENGITFMQKRRSESLAAHQVKLPKFENHPHHQHYPYLSWAEAHFLNAPPPFNLSRECFPLTWESRASQAEYEGMRIINPEYVTYRICKPHTWHAAEMFLYLYELSD